MKQLTHSFLWFGLGQTNWTVAECYIEQMYSVYIIIIWHYGMPGGDAHMDISEQFCVHLAHVHNKHKKHTIHDFVYIQLGLWWN